MKQVKQLIVLASLGWLIMITPSCNPFKTSKQNSINSLLQSDSSMTAMNARLDLYNKSIYDYIANAQSDPGLSANARVWEEKANNVRQTSDKFIRFLESLKVELKLEAGSQALSGSSSPGGEQYKYDDTEAATRLFGDSGKKQGQALLQEAGTFKNNITGTDIQMTQQINTFFSGFSLSARNKSELDELEAMTAVEAVSRLSKYINDAKIIENKALILCAEQVGKIKLSFNQFCSLVSQSSNYVMPGQTIDISAGVGAYSSEVVPTVTIGGSAVPIGPEGRAMKSFVANGSGEQSVSVTVKFKNQQGVDQVENHVVKYTVGTPAGAAVMPDRMNVMYYGIDNPLTIGSPAGWDKTSVSGSGCSLSGSGASRIVRPAAIGTNATVAVTADGKTAQFQFRVKRIPDPIFKIGSGKSRIPVVEFKNQGYCRADMIEGFDFDVRYTIVSATVYFSGAGFSKEVTKTISGHSLSGLSAEMSRCLPGTAVTFDNIKVEGPDGIRTIESKCYSLY